MRVALNFHTKIYMKCVLRQAVPLAAKLGYELIAAIMADHCDLNFAGNKEWEEALRNALETAETNIHSKVVQELEMRGAAIKFD